MTEAEWVACKDPPLMLESLRGRASDRKFRLFAVGCCQRVWHLLHGETWRKAADVAQRLPDGGVSDEEHRAVFAQVCDKYEEYGVDPLYEEYGDYGEEPDSEQARQPEHAHAALAALSAVVPYDVDDGGSPGSLVKGVLVAYPYDCARHAAKAAARAVAYATARTAANPAATWEQVRQRESAAQTDRLRDIFGNPFRPVSLDPRCRTPEGVTLARRIYDERAFGDLPILADTLQDAGYRDDEILAHCRGPGPHVRGCWVVDLLLGKE
jgi:hypothetical protein